MKTSTNYLTANALLVALAIAVQLLGKSIPAVSQVVVGPFINAILILSLLFTNIKYAILLAAVTPITAFLTAQLTPTIGFFVPFICIGNIIFVICFNTINVKTTSWLNLGIKLVVAALCKYLFLSISATKVIVMINLGIAPKILDKLAIAMGIPQLYTALTGGIIGIILFKIINPKINSYSN